MNNFSKQFTQYSQRTSELLPDVDNISTEQAQHIIRRYNAVFEGNFLSWMAAAAISSRSIEARFAAEENLQVEIVDDHPGMLRAFAESIGCLPTDREIVESGDYVRLVRNLVSRMSGFKNVCLMALLENLSLVFIPTLSQIAKKFPGHDLTYTDVHGEADITHAQQFNSALTIESHHGYGDLDAEVEEVYQVVEKLLKYIFAS